MFENKSLLDNFWQLEDISERLILSLSQRNNITPLLAKLLYIRKIDTDSVKNFLKPIPSSPNFIICWFVDSCTSARYNFIKVIFIRFKSLNHR